MTPFRVTVLAFACAAVVGCAHEADKPANHRPAVQPKMTQPPPDRNAPATAVTPAPKSQPGITPTATPREEMIPAPSAPSASEAPRVTQPSRDPVQACIERIPGGASAAQRSFAEQTCMREYEAQRQSPALNQPFASGTQGDTLDACMSRIPSNASAGQRMIAEESCRRDEDLRHGFGSIPGR